MKNKVYYNIFAGNDTSVGYTVYLGDPPESPESLESVLA